jgi:uncharacterized hydrophobic protein (TIGR00271 family)
MARFNVEAADIERIAEKTLLSYGQNSSTKHSQFWILMALAGVIATAGVASDSTAMVIGAMIVAPLITPIMGTAFSLLIADRHYLMHSLLTLVGGALLVIGIAFLFSMAEPLGLFTEGNSQVLSRVQPRLIDLIAALATGMVGAFALVRSDISDTLPGVAIAISLVPPLAVVGLSLQDGRIDYALGALLLFVTNVAAIIFTATLVLLLYKVRETAKSTGYAIGTLRGWSLALVTGTIILVAIPLGFTTERVFGEARVKFSAAPVAEQWARTNDWKIIELRIEKNTLIIVAFGALPELDGDHLRAELDKVGLAELDLTVKLVIGGSRTFPGKRQTNQ